MRRLVFAVFGTIVLAACGPAAEELSEEQKAEIAAEVNMRLDALWDELKQPRFDLLMSYFVDSPNLLSVNNGGFISGYETVDSIYRPALANWEDQVLTVSATRTVVLAHDVVYTMRVGTDSITYLSGEAVPTRPWAATHVWVRSEGEWKILAAHGSHPSSLDR